jgi:SPP1 gp7 family putative phage head morphogenesis protein
MKPNEQLINTTLLDRQEGIEQADDVIKQIERIIAVGMASALVELSAWLTRMQETDYQDAKRRLTKTEIAAYQAAIWGILERERKALDTEWVERLEREERRANVTLIAALVFLLSAHIESAYTQYRSIVGQAARAIYAWQYARQADNIRTFLGFAGRAPALDGNVLDKIIKRPWASDGRLYSARIWADKDLLISTINTDLKQAFVRGDSVQQMEALLRKRFDVRSTNAERLIRTELAAYQSMANRDAYLALGVRKYKILAVMDERTCQTCVDLNGKIFGVRDFEIGVTAPPLHPNCRCRTIPV